MNTRHLVLALALTALCACTQTPETYRNLAHYRAALQSSAVNYDLTAQMVTDGLRCEAEPFYDRFYLNGRPLSKKEVEWLHDLSDWSQVNPTGGEVVYTALFSDPKPVDRLRLKLRPYYREDSADAPYGIYLYVSDDGEVWDLVYTKEGIHGPEMDPYWWDFTTEAALGRVRNSRGFKVELHAPDVEKWDLYDFGFLLGGEKQYYLGTNPIQSAWVAESGADEWVCIDLGALSTFDKAVIQWVTPPAAARLLASQDGKDWKTIASLDGTDTVRFAPAKGRYVKVAVDTVRGNALPAIGEVEIWGSNDLQPAVSDWYLVRADLADRPEAWIPAKVPGTVLASYIAAGAVPDPRYADNNQSISHSYFREDFIYRGTLAAPAGTSDKVWLDFDGINWKADVSMNGHPLGRIDGAFTRKRFDVTDILQDRNTVEVRIHHLDHPGVGRGNTIQRNAFNGGVIGYDSPSFLASIGWDWMPSLAGRNIGIWNDVRLVRSGKVLLRDPQVVTRFPEGDTTRAVIAVGATLVNTSDAPSEICWSGSVGEERFAQTVTLQPGEKRAVDTTLVMENPRLWWPNGYGEPYLYDAAMQVAGHDSTAFKVGVRQMTYDTSDGRLTGYINGRRLVARGGNWGFSEANLGFTAREYDIAVDYHRQQHFTMIRNWVGQTGDEEFYEACDRHGIMVWQDFWLANPGDGPNPLDEKMFLDNAGDYIRRIRNHPCIALYCGRNEGFPPERIDAALRDSVLALTPDIFYISHSSRGLVSGEGGYWRESAEAFFKAKGQDRIHSERGMPNMMNYESLIRMMPEEEAWPQGQLWAEHDWTLNSAQRAGTFNEAVEKMFGPAPDARTFCRWAQWVNYDGYRAMFEGRSAQRRGLLLWMSHSAWPSLVWSTYDYWFDPTASFFGAKKACEPLHIQWNPVTRKVEVVNVSARDRKDLTASAEVLDMYGHVQDSVSMSLDSDEDSTVECMRLEPQDADVWFYRLRLSQGDSLLSENCYVQGRETDNFRALLTLPKPNVSIRIRDREAGRIVAEVRNLSETPALMVHLIARSAGDERVLPVNYSDNYFHLMGGESRIVTVLVAEDADLDFETL